MKREISKKKRTGTVEKKIGHRRIKRRGNKGTLPRHEAGET